MKTNMKLKNLLSGLMIACAATSCIQDEALNVEAAIDGCEGKNILLTDINHDSKKIEVYLPDIDLAEQELIFTLPIGAEIKIADANENDVQPAFQKDSTWLCYCNFNQEKQRRLTVTSENGANEANYTLRVITMDLSKYTEYSFENLKETNPYHILYLTDQSGIMQWASGNPGFEISGMANDAADYPTVQAADGVNGKCVKLTTRDTGNFGKPIGMPIAAGNLFIGSFDVRNAVQQPRLATLFGFPFNKKPLKMTGYYKYKAGETFTDGNKNEVPGQKDTGDIYAALYEAPKSNYSLNGHLFHLYKANDKDKLITDSNGNLVKDTQGPEKSIVLLARIQDMTETDEWTRFELDFQPQNGKQINEADLKEGKYKLAVVFTSSIEGAYFRGAIGSELCIDEVEIIYEQ